MQEKNIIHIGSYYYHSTLSLKVHLSILYFFSTGLSVTNCLKHLAGQISKKTLIQLYSYYHDIMTTYLARNPVSFNSLVHVDEMAIGGCRKYNRGNRECGETHWIFGIIDKEHHKCHMKFT